MKWIHLADLHIGKQHDAADLEADQKAVLNEIAAIVRAEKPDGVLIAGDVYDRSLPPERAVQMLNDFLNALCSICPVYLISGNHDSGKRLGFMSQLLAKQNLFIRGGYNGVLTPVTQGDTDLYLLPYLHPAEVRRVLKDDSIINMSDAVRAVLSTMVPGKGKRKILLAHLFAVAGEITPETCDSEQKYIGGLDQVDVSLFNDFDYVALGHIHGCQKVGRETVRYAGTPMMYSFSEQFHHKSVCVVDLENEPSIRMIPLTSPRKMRVVRGSFEELLTPGFDNGNKHDIVLAELTDPLPVIDAQTRLSTIYETVLVKYVSLCEETHTTAYDPAACSLDDPLSLFSMFFAERNNGVEMTQEQRTEVAKLLEMAKEEE